MSLASDARAEEVALDARVTFTASGPLGLRVRTRGKELRCFEDGKSLVFSVPLPGITTGIALRDAAIPHHMGFGLKSQAAVKVVFSVFAKALPGLLY